MKFLLALFLLPLQLFAQDVTGVWTGTLYSDTTKQFFKYELAISEYNGKLSGYSHTTFVIDGVENIGVKSIKIKKAGNKYFLEDNKLVYDNYTDPPAKGVRTYSELFLLETDSKMILKGPWKTNTTKVFRTITGDIFLQKKKELNQTLIIQKLENLGLAQSLSFMPVQTKSADVAIITTPSLNLEKQEKLKNNAEEDSSESKRQISQKSSQDNGRKMDKTSEELKKETRIRNRKIEMQEIAETNKKGQNNGINDVSSTNLQTSKAERTPAEKKQNTNKKTPDVILKKDTIATITAKPESVPKAAEQIASRKIETVRSVEIKSDSLLLTLYDNGEIDGDTVSVLLNGKIIMPLQGLTAKGISKTIYLTPEMGDSLVLIMYAENLGSIPPNTGLLVVHDGDAVYEIRFSGDLKKNSAIILKREREN